MNAQELLSDLRAAGYVLAIGASGIDVYSAKDLTDELRASIRAVRSDLLQVLEAEEADRVRLMTLPEFAAELGPTARVVTGAEQIRTAPHKPVGIDTELPILDFDATNAIVGDALRTRLHKTAARIGRLIELGLGDSEEAQELQAERDWIENKRPEAWGSVQPKPRIVRLAALAHVPIGALTPPEHLAAIGGKAAVLEACPDMGVAYRLNQLAELYVRDGPGASWAEQYAFFWGRYTT